MSPDKALLCKEPRVVLMCVLLRPHRGLMVKQKALHREEAGICPRAHESEKTAEL